MLKVWAMNPSRQRRGLMSVTGLNAVLRETDIGTWIITADGNHWLSSQFDKGWRVVVYDDNDFLFSGPATVIKRTFKTASSDLEISGETDMCIFNDRIVYPAPATNPTMSTPTGSAPTAGGVGGESYTAGAGTTATAAELLIVRTINDHVSAASPLSQRRTDGVAAMPVPGSPRGTAITLSARLTLVLDEIRYMATLGGLIVDCGQTANSTAIVPSIRVPRDLTNRIRFTNKNGLGEHEVIIRAPTITTAFAGGAGDGTRRDMLGENGPVRWGNRRIERFLDRRDVADGDSNGLLRAAREAYTEAGESAAVRFELTETAQLRFGRDFLLGDDISVITPRAGTFSGGVATAELDYNAHGRTVRLTIGETVPAQETAPEWVKRVRKFERAQRRLEGSK